MTKLIGTVVGVMIAKGSGLILERKEEEKGLEKPLIAYFGNERCDRGRDINLIYLRLLMCIK